MWPRKSATPADHLSRYWTALVGGAPPAELARLAEPLDAETLAAVERLRALRPRHRPDPTFLDRLERDALAAFTRARTASAPAGLPGTRPAPRDGSRPSAPHRWMPPVGRQTRRWVIAELAVAAVVLIAFVLGDRIFEDNAPATIVAPSVVASPSARPATPMASPQVRAPGAGINVANGDGSGAVGLYDGQDAHHPSWSPDGTRIVFAGTGGIAVIGVDGNGLTSVVDTAEREILPVWSPDGARIAFATVTGRVYVVDVDGTDLTQVAAFAPLVATPEAGPVEGVEYVDQSAYRWRPSWSPDGSRLAVVAGQADASQIFVVAPDGSGSTQLTDLAGNATAPAWSPDGAAIAFVYTPQFGLQPGVYVVALDGTAPRRLADLDPDAGAAPSWSRDGRSLLAAGQSEGVIVVRVGGSGVVRLSTLPSGVTAPIWSPDGAKIAFIADDIPYVIGLDGSGLVRLADLPSDGATPTWSPDGSRILFACQDRAGTP